MLIKRISDTLLSSSDFLLYVDYPLTQTDAIIVKESDYNVTI